MYDGPALAELRATAGITQLAVAERLGVTDSAICHLEAQGYVKPATSRRFMRGVIQVVREEAAGAFLADTMKAIIRDRT